jgi:Primase C terminal 2 (PriCT-2)/Family of unknown function (DUF5906)
VVDISKHNPNFEFQVVFIQTLASFGNPNAVGVKTANGHEMQRRKFGADAARAHLLNSTSYATYQVVGNKTQSLVIDIDNHDGELALEVVIAQADEIAKRFMTNDLRPFIYVSGGGAGAHIWIVFEHPQIAAKVTAYARSVVSALGLSVGTGGLRAQQYAVGSMIALPLSRKSKAIDLDTLSVIELADFVPPDSFALFSPDIPVATTTAPKSSVSKRQRTSIIGVEADGGAESELEALQSALGVVPADDFEIWRDVGFALKLEFGEDGFPLWHEWSKSSATKYDGESDCRKSWESLKPNGKLTVGTIYHHAKENGWNGKRPSLLHEMNRKYAVLTMGTRTSVICKIPNEESGDVFQFIGKQQLFDRHKPDKIVREDDQGNLVKLPLAEIWFNSPQASRYTGIDFNPTQPPGENGTVWNLWRGFAVVPKPGSWELLKEHIFTNISSCNHEIYEWFLNWMALGVQKPGEVIGTTPVMRGYQGTGKGVFANSYGALWGIHFITITQSEQVSGRFNAHFFGRRFIFIDEGLFGGNRKEAGVIKTRITEDYIMLELKGVDAVKMRNRSIFMVASNNPSIVPADLGDRRWMVVDVADTHKEDHPYFAAIATEMENGGKEAMLYELLQRDITKGPNPRRVIKTEARVMQILMAESPYVKFLHSLLDQGRLPQNAVGSANTTTTKALVHDLTRNYSERHLNDVGLGKLLREILPTITSRPNGKYVSHFTPDGPVMELSTEYTFPPLPDARKLFEARLGGFVPWSNNLEKWQADPAFPGAEDFDDAHKP